MRLQILSDLHLETETVDLRPAEGAEALILAGDIDTTWQAYARFADWPVPVVVVAGNHEFDGRDLVHSVDDLQALCDAHGFRLLHRSECVLADESGRRVRFVGTPRWSDFALFGPAGQVKAERAAAYYIRLMKATRAGQPLDVAGMQQEGALCRAYLEAALAETPDAEATVVITHFGPSLRSGDPRYGRQPGTASFCNADDDLIPRADLWVHGHVHCRHDYGVDRPGLPGRVRPTRVVSQARGLAKKGEPQGWDPMRLFEV